MLDQFFCSFPHPKRDCRWRPCDKKFIKVDKKLYKEMKKKSAGHYLVSYSCFNYYHPKIIEFIESRI